MIKWKIEWSSYKNVKGNKTRANGNPTYSWKWCLIPRRTFQFEKQRKQYKIIKSLGFDQQQVKMESSFLKKNSSSWKSIMTTILLLLLCPVFVIPQGSNCPRKCQCIWRESKITVDCSDKSLAGIPTTVETNTQGKMIISIF